MSIFSQKYLLSSIIGKYAVAVNSVLGQPVETIETQYYNEPNAFKSTYLNGQIEVVFINGVSQWITDNSAKDNRLIRVGNIRHKLLSINEEEDFAYYKYKTK
jgi:ABC-type oligopeptide transport system substrate-binding subunit